MVFLIEYAEEEGPMMQGAVFDGIVQLRNLCPEISEHHTH